MSRILRSDLKLGAFRRSTGQFLTPALKANRKVRCKALLQRYVDGRHRSMLFYDE
jgi:hypothetical protein